VKENVMINEFEGALEPLGGVTVRVPGVTMLVLPGSSQAAATAALIELAVEIDGDDPRSGRRLARLLAAALSGVDGDDFPPFAVVADDADGLVVFVHGGVRVEIEGDEALTITGDQSATWIDRIVARPPRAIRLGSAGADGKDALRLQAPRVVASAESAPFPPPVLLMPDPERDVEVRRPLPVETVEPDPEPDGADLVEGILCSREHLSNPAAPYCSVCGISLVHRTHNVVRGPRPPLGVLVFDDGSTYTLDHGYVLGRQPDDDPLVVRGERRPLVVDDPDRSVSRVHGEVVLDGWDVRVVDRGSANGTFVFDAEQEAWHQLTPDQAVTIAPSTRVAVGNRTFVFETPHQPAACRPIGRRVVPARGAA
jgi:catechol 2,3-dioxygenase-like lactoylglutathione lyase family enzyme